MPGSPGYLGAVTADSFSYEFKVKKDADAVRDALKTFAGSRGATIAAESPTGDLTICTGSKVHARLMGAHLTPLERFPFRTVVRIVSDVGPTTIQLSVQDGLGKVIRTGARSRNAIAADKLAADVQAAVENAPSPAG